MWVVADFKRTRTPGALPLLQRIKNQEAFMSQPQKQTAVREATSTDDLRPLITRVHGVRYQVNDVSRAIAFYTQQLGFKLNHQHLPEFASLSLGDVQILLSGPGASGSRALPGGQRQAPGGSNRVVLEVTDLPRMIDALKKRDAHFRNDMESGPAGRQIQIEDPDGNPIELFQPANRKESA
jgi:glyoxylase I family protein